LENVMMSRRQLIVGLGGLGIAGAASYFATRGPNYETAVTPVWQATKPQGDADMVYLVHYATLAANNHNVQPWRFKTAANGVSIIPDLSRATPVVDPDNHHLFASLGCACENLMLTAGSNNQSAPASFVADGDGEVRIDLARGPATSDPLFDAITERQCTRAEYDGRGVGTDVIAALEKAAMIDGCRVILISDKPKMEQVLDLILAGNTAEIGNPAFVKELKSWLRFNAASALQTGDGLYSACSGNPAMPTWLGRTMFDFAFTAKAENDKCAKQVRSSSGLAIFVADKNDKEIG
jgi:hypothetical protein